MDGIIEPSALIQTAQLVSIPSAFFVAGYCLSFSQNVFPAIYDHRPQFSANAFRQIWASAGPIVPTLTFVSTAAYAYLAYAATVPEQRRGWIKAAVAMFLTVPWTGIVMGPGIKRLNEIGNKKEAMLKSEQTLEHRQLLIRWAKQNYVAVALQISSAVFGVRALLHA